MGNCPIGSGTLGNCLIGSGPFENGPPPISNPLGKGALGTSTPGSGSSGEGPLGGGPTGGRAFSESSVPDLKVVHQCQVAGNQWLGKHLVVAKMSIEHLLLFKRSETEFHALLQVLTHLIGEGL